MEKVAIIGLSCLFPDAQTPDQFWQNLLAGRRSVTMASEQDMGFNAEIFYDPVKGRTAESGKYYCQWGGYLHDFQFDPTGYQLPPESLSHLDELHQWTLYVSRHALQDSGYLNHPALAKCGVLMGSLSIPTKLSNQIVGPIYLKALEAATRELMQQPDLDLASYTPAAEFPWVNLFISGFPVSLIAQALGLANINFSLDAACASSIYAIQLSCQYLLSRKADLMIATAVSGSDPFLDHTAFSVFQAYPEGTGMSRPLDEVSPGLLTGKGAGAVILKRYEDAVRDGDRIYAVISGIGVSNDGKGKHFLSPNPKGQTLAFERAYESAGISPSTVDYVECHATGTFLGDRTELNSMESFWQPYGKAPLVGSVKSNLGHLLTAAGMPSLMKVILSMQHGVIPPTVNVEKPLASANNLLTPNHIVTQTTPWDNPQKRAAVSAFGFGGCNSHLVIEHPSVTQATALPPAQPIQPKPLAIVGMEAFFGEYKNLNEFERAIYEGKQTRRSVPNHRWRGLESQPEILAKYGLESPPEGGYIESFDMDYMQFRIPAGDNDAPIPQQLLMLKVTDAAIQDSQIKPGSNVGVLIAMESDLTIHRIRGRCDLLWQIRDSLARVGIELSAEKLDELETVVGESLRKATGTNQILSFIGNIMASRVATQWDFSGPAFTLSAEENSVFKALEVAQLMLASDPKLEAIVLGAVDLTGNAENVLLFQNWAKTNTGTNTLSFDRNSNGWMIGEGAGAVVLKRVEDARTSGDRIYAVIDGVALVQDLNPSEQLPCPPRAEAVTQACQTAFAQLGVHPDNIGYLEVCGSGIPDDDAAEVAGLTAAYRTPSGELSCGLGSIKANIGHTFAASGMASLIKTALCLHHRYLPMTPNWSGPKQPEQWQGTPFFVPTRSRLWDSPPPNTRRRAAINGLGIDRTYAHVILSEEPFERDYSTPHLQRTPFHLFPLAGADANDLIGQIQQLQNALAQTDSLAGLASRTFLAYQSRAELPYAIALVGHTVAEVEKEIQRAYQGLPKAFSEKTDWKTPLGSYFSGNPQGRKGGVAFVYPGGFTTYLNVAPDVFRLFPKTLDLIDHWAQHGPKMHQMLLTGNNLFYPKSLEKLTLRQLEAKEDELMDDALSMFVSNLVSATGFTRVMRDFFKVEPQAAFGYSVGEFAMMFAQEVWTKGETIMDRINTSELLRSRILGPKNAIREFWGLPPAQERASDDFWSIYVVIAPAETVQVAIQQETRAYLTQINTPNEVVIAGEKAACLRVIEALGAQAVKAPFNYAIHCEAMRSEEPEIARYFDEPISVVPKAKIYSAADNRPLEFTKEGISRDIARMMGKQVNFPGLIQQVYADGARVFIELGAGSTCTRWIDENLKGQEHVTMVYNLRGTEDHVLLVRMIGKLLSHRVSMDLSPLYDLSIAQPAPKKGLVKPVTLGGRRILEAALTPENRAKFPANVITRVPAKTEAAHWWLTQLQPRVQPTIAPAAPVPDFVPPNLMPQLATAATQSPTQSLSGRSLSATAQSHLQVLQARQTTLQALSASLSGAIAETSQQFSGGGGQPPSPPNLPNLTPYVPDKFWPQYPPVRTKPKPAGVIFDEADMVEFACGKLANVFGPEYAEVDTYPHRIRLPMPPYMFLSRVTKLEAQRGVFEPCFIETEFDIPEDAWYAVDGDIPSAVIIEGCHGNMILSSYVGVDFVVKGERIYRATGGHLTFTDYPPKAGETIRCEVRINRFVQNGNMLMYFFSSHYFVGDRKFMEMESGGGFFSPEELAGAPGVVYSKMDLAMRAKIPKRHFQPLLTTPKTSFDLQDLLQITLGNHGACFGANYEEAGRRNPSLRTPPRPFCMVDRVLSVDPHGGTWGLGEVIAEKDIDPDHWYFNCHFKDDYCLPGTLICEGATQLLGFYLLYLGLQTRTTNASFQLIPGLTQHGNNKGQVTINKSTLIYRLEIMDIGFDPHPYVSTEATVTYQGKTISLFKNLGMQLVEP